MHKIMQDPSLNNADCANDLNEPIEPKQEQLSQLEGELATLPKGAERARKLLDYGTLLLDFQRWKDAWDAAWEAFEYFSQHDDWEHTVVATDVLFSAEQPDSNRALGHGIWLAVSAPINPETSVAILDHLMEESPVGSETSVIAAVTAHFLADVRSEPDSKSRENLMFFTNQRLAEAAAKHRPIQTQQEFEIWMQGNQFDTPEYFLPRLSAAVDAMVDGQWWFDRDAIRARFSGE
jgi:hypothetical protein